MWRVRLYGNFFLHYLINGTIFEKNFIEYKMCVLIFSTILPETFLILRRTEQDMMKMYVGLHVNCLFFLSDFNEI